MTADFVRELLDSDGGVIYFPNSGLFENGIKIDNVMFTIPGLNLEIYWYGFLIALGMVLAMIYAYRRVRKFGLEPDRFTDTVLAGFIGGIIGARAYYVVFSLDKYLTDEGTFDLWAALSIRDGGLAIYGGVIGALIFGLLVAKIRKVKIAPLLDLAGLGFLIGQCIGRWGNFFNQEAFGSKTSLPWGMVSKDILNELYFFYYPENVSVIANRALDMIAHPCFLYESLWCLVGFLALHFYSKHRKFDGEIFLLYIGWYGLGRFWIEGLRTDSLYLVNTETLKLKVSQLVAGTCVIFAAALLIYMYVTVKKKGYTFYYATDESKELLRLYDEKNLKSRRKRGKNADDEVEEHILAADAEGENVNESSGEETPSDAETESADAEDSSDTEDAEEENSGSEQKNAPDSSDSYAEEPKKAADSDEENDTKTDK
ncbi:MAG TPA: prolipoprotein diacylglyceryl transferase [Candidatus Faeciplasma gallinarum]|uniref:Phosphatidylglycerol--prolipoprotein diacylglyceryl transferase n=1 Tax=Candidatus Faeciplasma gallinarum TaxID=2840799 RepID=A0A9D1EP61_9FIRM|nr:prolipoprotein diacylglyceryl transferase [Candidatus Faeciplasma gallinarum]